MSGGLLPRELAFGLGGAALLAALALFDASAAARGLLAAFVAALSIPAGCLLLLLVHQLTGGRWGEAARPAFVLGARAFPVVALLFLPVLFALPLVYPWAGHPAAVRHPDVARFYLNAPAFALRGIGTLALWTFLALRAAREPRPGPLFAGLALLLYGATVSLVSVDWVLSLDPRFGSSAFAMSMAVSHLLAGAAFAGLLAEGEGAPDLLKLAATFALGLVYLDAMQFLVVFDGNLPEKAAWYLRRSGAGWNALLLLALLLGGVLPVASLLRERWRGSARLRRRAAGLVLVGLFLRTLWWILPEWGGAPPVWLALALALLALGGLALGLRDIRWPVRTRAETEAPHGA